MQRSTGLQGAKKKVHISFGAEARVMRVVLCVEVLAPIVPRVQG